MMMYGFGGGSSLLWGLSMLISMILPVIIIVGIVYLGIGLWERKKKTSPGGIQQDPLSILKKRYASGEITREDFDRMKEDLLRS